jgi:hypothetical protein
MAATRRLNEFAIRAARPLLLIAGQRQPGSSNLKGGRILAIQTDKYASKPSNYSHISLGDKP